MDRSVKRIMTEIANSREEYRRGPDIQYIMYAWMHVHQKYIADSHDTLSRSPVTDGDGAADLLGEVVGWRLYVIDLDADLLTN